MKFTGSSLFFSAVYLASIVAAQKSIVSITSPLANTKYKAGQEAIISWINPTVQTIPQIVLAKGPSTALQPIMTIATNVNANDMKYVWKIPDNLEIGTEYAFELGSSPDLAFAGPFIVESGGSSASPSSNSSPSSGSTSSSSSPASGNNNAVATPAAPSSTSGSTSQTSSNNNPNTSHTSAGNKQYAGSAMIAFGVTAAIASQFF